MAAFTQRDVENVMRTIFRRCVVCPNEAPSCPDCTGNTQCVQTTQSCDSCAQAECKAIGIHSSDSDSGKANVGGIAGGVIGGVAFIAILVFVIWRFCLKGRRRPYEGAEWNDGVDMPGGREKTQDEFVSRRSARESTHTVASMASSVLTRASNIIQIAYIPGVTNRSGPGSPDVLVPPVPPIPAMSTPSSGLSSPYTASEQHFFVPDFRDSMASGSTDLRSSYARTSIAPSLARTSVASTVYRQNAIVSPLPAQTVVRGKAAVVSVKSSGSNTPDETPISETPPVPQIDPKHTVKPIRIQMPGMSNGSSSVSPQSSIRSTATLGPVRALNITKKKGSDVTPPKSSSSNQSDLTGSTAISDHVVQTMRPLTEYSVVSSDDGLTHARARKAGDVDSDSDSDDDDHARARRSLLRASDLVSEFSDTPSSLQSPFSDNSSIDRPSLPQRQTSRSSRLQAAPMTPIVEESTKRHSDASKRTQSPFSDDHRSDL